VIELLADIDKENFTPEAFWIIEAGSLNKSSKLRLAFEDSKNATALQLYEDDEAAVSDLVTKRLAGAGIAIEPLALANFVAELPGDRRMALSEIEKLELYGMNLGRAVNETDISQLASAEQPRGADDAADAAILGDIGQATLSINRFLDAGGNPISAMRTLHFRLTRVSDAVAQNAGTGARLRPPIYDREWPAFSRALRDFPAPVIRRAFTRLYEAEKSCKQAGAPSDAILRNLIHRVATRAI
jgi:DNA polymerase-3 subunit delta